MRLNTFAVALVGFGLLTGCSPPDDGATAGRPIQQARVVAVVDGDTIEIELAISGTDSKTVTESVRLLGIDTPETVHPTVPEQCFGKQASDALAQLLPPETVVRIERDVEARDHFDRLLLYIYRQSDGLFINEWMVTNGLADATFYEPNTAHRSAITRAQQQARRDGVGLWSNCDGPDQPLK